MSVHEVGSGKAKGGPSLGIPTPLMEDPGREGAVETATPSNSRERPRPPMSESTDSRATSLGAQDPSNVALGTEALDKLLFGAIYSLTRGLRQGASGDAVHEVSQLVSMASNLRVGNPNISPGAQKELQERCQRLVARLPTVPSDPCSSGSEDVRSQGGPSDSGSLEALHRAGSNAGTPSRLSLDSRLSTRVLLPRQQQPQQQPRTASSSPQGSRRRPASVNPFDLARSEDGRSVEAIEEEDEMEFMVEEVTTPGGTVREVVVHESSNDALSGATAPKARARSEEIADRSPAAEDTGADEAPGADAQQLEFRVASVNDPADTDSAPNPFAAARAIDTVAAAANIVQPLPAKRRQGSLGMAREDLLSRVGKAPDLASAAEATVFLDSLASDSSLAGLEPSSSAGVPENERSGQEPVMAEQEVSGKVAAAVAGAATEQVADRQVEGRRTSRDSRRESGESISVAREKRRKGSGDLSRKASRTGSSQSDKSSCVISDVAERIKKRSIERNQQQDSGKDKGKQQGAAPKVKSWTSLPSGKHARKSGTAPPLITRLEFNNDYGEFNPFRDQKGWKIDFCCCPTSASLQLGDINSMTYPTFHEAAEELSRQATVRAAKAKERGDQSGLRNDPMGTGDSGLSAIDNDFLTLTSGTGGGTMYSEFVPRRAQQEVLSPSATALPATRPSGMESSTSLGSATRSTTSHSVPSQPSTSVVMAEDDSDKVKGCGCWPFGR